MSVLNRYSRTLTQEVTNPAAQAMLYGIGLKEEQLALPQIGIASTGYEGNPCNMPVSYTHLTLPTICSV